jgi:hypothetical protein
MAKKPYLTRLLEMGFDNSEHIPLTKNYKIRCSQCLAAVINNIPTHEQGCPNQPQKERDEDE